MPSNVKKYLLATGERMVRGGAIAVAAVYFGGGMVFDSLDVNSWSDAAGLFISGAVGSLILSLAGQVVSGNGPSFTDAEQVEN